MRRRRRRRRGLVNLLLGLHGVLEGLVLDEAVGPLAPAVGGRTPRGHRGIWGGGGIGGGGIGSKGLGMGQSDNFSERHRKQIDVPSRVDYQLVLVLDSLCGESYVQEDPSTSVAASHSPAFPSLRSNT